MISIFHPLDAAQLLFSTNVGRDGKAQYLAACGLDYNNPFKFYDLFVTRDLEGYSMGLPFYPIFSNAGKAQSRSHMLSQSDAVPVKSCWSGMLQSRPGTSRPPPRQSLTAFKTLAHTPSILGFPEGSQPQFASAPSPNCSSMHANAVCSSLTYFKSPRTRETRSASISTLTYALPITQKSSHGYRSRAASSVSSAGHIDWSLLSLICPLTTLTGR